MSSKVLLARVTSITNGMTNSCLAGYYRRMPKEQNVRREADVSITQRIGPWQVELSWPDDSFQVGPVLMAIRPADEATDDELIGGLSSTVLRQIDFPAAREEWLVERATRPRELTEAVNPELFRPPMNGTAWRAEGLQETLARDGVSEGYLALLAEAYVSLVHSGERSVAAKLAEMTGRSPDTMKQHLHRVRKAGMLTSIPGKAGGRLTPKAFKAVQETLLGPHDPHAEWEMAERLAAKMGKPIRPRTET